MATVTPPGYLEIITMFYPGRTFGITGPLYNDIDWAGGTPIPQADLDALQVPCYIALIKSALSDFIRNWIDQGYTYLGDLYDASPPTYQNMQGTMLVITSGGTLLPNFVWWDAANTGHPMNAGTFTIFYNSFTAWYNAVYQIGYSKKLVVGSFASMSECASYDLALGWPSSDVELAAWYASNNIPMANPRRVITTLSFRQRFTAEERGSIASAATASLDAGDPTLQVYIDDLGASVVVDLDDPETVAAVNLLSTSGLLDPSRVSAILADAQDDELAS